MRFRTRAIHTGQEPDAVTGDTIPAIHVSTTYTQDGVGGHKGFEYSRTGNPTRASLETLIASLEGARHGLAFSSGMAATHAVLTLLEEGSHVVLSTDVYGGTYRLVDKLMDERGLDYSLVDTTDLPAVAAALREETRLLFVETPTNPLLKVMDVRALKETAGAGVLLVVDNTFATPYFQQPLTLGADVVVHSSTKYLGGHSDVVGGLVAVDDASLAERLAFIQNAVGAVPSPFDCFLTIRGIKTLPVRMEAHQGNATRVARFLEGHERVEEVFYPGFSGIVSFRIAGGGKAARAFLERLRVFSLAESLGGVESLACLPCAMTHACFEEDFRRSLGIGEDLIRLSVGLEDIDDLLADLTEAFGDVG
ncbi:MAG: cystathionine gamma-synthase [Actinobacteria bacterium]|nr:MAG: cystathionine gamma-synthase [Actinomycetota bacterium]